MSHNTGSKSAQQMGIGSEIVRVALVGLVLLAAFAAGTEAAEDQDQQRDQLAQCMKNLREVVLGIHMYAADHRMRLPADLGETVVYVKAAKPYICPLDPNAAKAPEKATAEWVNQSTSYVYLGGAGVMLQQIKQPAKIVMVHEKLDAGHPDDVVVVAYADGHVQAIKKGEAKAAIEESEKAMKAVGKQ